MAEGAGSEVALSSVAFDQILSYLNSKDDTHRFVGLSLLQKVIDEKEEVRKDRDVVGKAWAAVSAKFLHRLLNAQASERRAPEEANSMVSLAVSIVHTFCVLLPSEALQEPKMLSVVDGLVHSLVDCDLQTSTPALQALISISSSKKGADEILLVKDLSPIIRTLPIQEEALHLLPQLALRAGDPDERLEGLMVDAARRYSRMDATPIIKCWVDILSITPHLESYEPLWILPCFDVVKETVLEYPTQAALELSTKAISLASTFDVDFRFFERHEERTDNNKPFSNFFIDLVLIDIRTAIPSLLELFQRDLAAYKGTGERVASELNVIALALRRLMGVLDEDDEDSSLNSKMSGLSMEPSDVLKLQKDLHETMSLLIEFIRDRWESAIDVKTETSGQSHPALLSPPTPTTNVAQSQAHLREPETFQDDPVILLALQLLSILLFEDRNEQLVRETTSIFDILVEMYKGYGQLPDKGGNEADVLVILTKPMSISLGEEDANNEMSTTSTDSPVNQFLDLGGWKVIAEPLLRDALLKTNTMDDRQPIVKLQLNLLSAVVNNPAIHQSKAQWISTMDKLLSPFSDPTLPSAYNDRQFLIRLWNLVLDILEKAPTSIQKQRRSSVQKALSRAMKDAGVVSMMDDEDEDDYEPDSLGAVLQEVEMLLLSFSPKPR